MVQNIEAACETDGASIRRTSITKNWGVYRKLTHASDRNAAPLIFINLM